MTALVVLLALVVALPLYASIGQRSARLIARRPEYGWMREEPAILGMIAVGWPLVIAAGLLVIALEWIGRRAVPRHQSQDIR